LALPLFAELEFELALLELALLELALLELALLELALLELALLELALLELALLELALLELLEVELELDEPELDRLLVGFAACPMDVPRPRRIPLKRAAFNFMLVWEDEYQTANYHLIPHRKALVSPM